ncbi:hypothetical protein TNCV_59341 [Trichonephila clavipes]|nr:hypothetical protein TNCV_59341 [Trichonephila clavipes]
MSSHGVGRLHIVSGTGKAMITLKYYKINCYQQRETFWGISHGFFRTGVLPQNWGKTDLNRLVISMVLKATVKDRDHLALCHDEFRGNRSVLCRSNGISNNNNSNNQLS